MKNNNHKCELPITEDKEWTCPICGEVWTKEPIDLGFREPYDRPGR